MTGQARKSTRRDVYKRQGFYYALYNVASAHFTLPLCPVGRFRSAGLFYCRLKSCLLQKFFGKFSKKRAESSVSGVILAEREKSTRHPHRKGVRRWKLSLATMANSTDYRFIFKIPAFENFVFEASQNAAVVKPSFGDRCV